MIASTIRELLGREPFQPFRIRSSSGAVYKVSSPYLVALMKSEVFIAEPNSDRWAQLPYLHIAAVGAERGRQTRRSWRGRR